MDDWQPEHWDNLEEQAQRILTLLAERATQQDNRAWRLKLRLAIKAIAGFQEAPGLRFAELSIGDQFTHPQFGIVPFTKETHSTAIRQDEDGQWSRYTPLPSQPVDYLPPLGDRRITRIKGGLG